MLPKVTIGVCVKNGERTICDVVDSIIIQDFPHKFIEIIFVDDGSEDNTLSIMNNYVNKIDIKTKVFHHEWKGLGESRNVVVRNAKGEYILWVDGDMILPSEYVRKQVDFMNKNPDVGIAKARYRSCSEGSLVGFLEDAAFIAVDFQQGGRITSRTVGTGGFIYRISAIRDIGGFDDRITGAGEDTDAEYRIRESGLLVYLGTPTFFYERHRRTWGSLWKEYFWHGYGIYSVYHKNKVSISLLKMVPFAGFFAGLWYSTIAYKFMHQKRLFIMPIQYIFKRTAWLIGFIKAQTV